MPSCTSLGVQGSLISSGNNEKKVFCIFYQFWSIMLRHVIMSVVGSIIQPHKNVLPVGKY